MLYQLGCLVAVYIYHALPFLLFFAFAGHAQLCEDLVFISIQLLSLCPYIQSMYEGKSIESNLTSVCKLLFPA